MKYLLCALSLCIFFPVAAYQVGPTNRANFDAATQSQGQPSQGGYRAFSNSNNRFGQGVQTSTVQTSVAGSSVTDFSTGKQPTVGKKSATPPAKGNKPSSVTPAAAAPTSSVQAASAAMPANADPATMMQQVQGMMQNMQALTGGASPATGQAGAPAMPAMPDISALMNGMMNPAAATTTPVKK